MEEKAATRGRGGKQRRHAMVEAGKRSIPAGGASQQAPPTRPNHLARGWAWVRGGVRTGRRRVTSGAASSRNQSYSAMFWPRRRPLTASPATATSNVAPGCSQPSSIRRTSLLITSPRALALQSASGTPAYALAVKGRGTWVGARVGVKGSA